MTAVYYNEIDAYAAQWLRNLIVAGHLPSGDVDERSIVDVRSEELGGYAQCHFFAGIGGWPYALRLAGWPDDRPVWTGSCPCQPFSAAGKQKGFADERHLWPSWRGLIAERSPPVVFGEQVASATAWLYLVRSDLEALGYAVGAMPIEAASAGADHLRDRFWFVGHRGGEGLALGSIAEKQRGTLREERSSVGAAGDRGGRLVTPCKYFSCCAYPNECDDPNRCCDRARAESRTLAEWDASLDGPLPDPSRQQARSAGQPREYGCVGDMGVSDSAGREPGEPSAEAARYGDSFVAAGGVDWVIGADGKSRRVKSGVRLLAHGVPNRVAKLRAFGNAIYPPLAAQFIGAFMECRP